METQGTQAPSFFEVRDGVKVIVRPMTKEEARIVFPYRPHSPYSESRWSSANHLYDDTCLLLNGHLKRCKMCQAPTAPDLLRGEACPDCSGRSEKHVPLDPHLPKDEYYRNPASRVRSTE